MDRRILSGGSLLVAALVFLAVNAIANTHLRSARIDLTANKLYTLSPGTLNIVTGLDEPVTLRLYLSQKIANRLPGINAYATRVRELLEEYARRSDGRIRLLVIDPEPFSEAEDDAVAHGLQGVPLEDGTATFYFGLVGTNSTDDTEVIPFFQPRREELLEYDISKLVYRLAHPEPPVIGLLSTLPVTGGPAPGRFGREPAWMIVEQIRQLFEIRELDTDVDRIPPEIRVLMIVHPKDLPPRTLYALDQFVLGGGRLLAFVDPYSEADTGGADPGDPLAALQARRSSDLEPLFKAWGLRLVPGKVAADLNGAQRVRTTRNGRTIVLDYPVWIQLGEDNLDPDDVVTARLGNVIVASPGILEPLADSGLRFDPLIRTSEGAMQIDAANLGMFVDPERLLREYEPGGQRLTLAARIEGPASTAFPDGPPAGAGDGEEDGAAGDSEGGGAGNDSGPANGDAGLKTSKGDINVIVIADTDLLQDRFWVQVQNFLGQRIGIPLAANDALVSNALDNLSGSSDLITIRSRASYARPFVRVEALQRAAEQRFREKEEQLQQRLQETEQRLRQLQEQKQGSDALILSPEQQAELERFQQERLRIRRELRDVQHRLRKDIEGLEGTVKFVNIGLMPILVGLAGVGVAAWRRRRRRVARGTLAGTRN